jgi:hypothetical protein
MPDRKVSAIHVPSDDEDHGDRQVVVCHIRQPQGLGLGMESTQEGENGCTRPRSCAKHMTCRVGILGVDPPVARKEWLETSGVRSHAEEVIPPHMDTP